MATRFFDNGASTGNLSTAANWSADTVPVADDIVWFEGVSGLTEIGAGLDALSNTSLTGNLDALFISAAATYRLGTAAAYAQIGTDQAEIGFWRGQGDRPNGSPRIKIDFGTQATKCRVYATAQTTTDANLDPLRLLFGSASSALDVYSEGQACRVGVAATTPAETSTLGTLNVYGPSAGVTCGPGTTLTNANSYAGNALLQAAPTNINVYGGIMKVAALSGTVTNTQVRNGGTLDIRGSNMTFTNPIDMYDGATLDARGFLGSLSGKIRAVQSGAFTIRTDAGVTI